MTKNKAVQAKTINSTSTFTLFPFLRGKLPYILLALLGVVFYYNTIYNEFALDDGIIIHKNDFVLKGVKGVKDIMTHDAYYSFYKQMNAQDQLSGGRYRPLSVVSFALEQEFIRLYPSGRFAKHTDFNNNAAVDEGEYNYAVDKNLNGKIEPNECQECWDINYNGVPDAREFDLNKNNKPDPEEDLNQNKLLDTAGTDDADLNGLVNERDCEVQGVGLRHFNNMLFFVMTILLLYYLLKTYLFKNNPDLSFLAALLFCIHPIHTEVVANMKSRDEIFSLIFIALTFIFCFRYIEHKRIIDAALAGLMTLLALFSKEYAFTLLALIPLTVYIYHPEKMNFKTFEFWGLLALLIVAVYFIGRVKLIAEKDPQHHKVLLKNLSSIFVFSVLIFAAISFFISKKEFRKGSGTALFACIGIAFMVYIAMRFYAVNLSTKTEESEILNNPYLLASPIEKVATKIFVLLKYMALLFFPHPLSSDYSFNTILYRKLSSWDVWLSFIVHLGLAWLTVRLFFKRHPLSFAMLFYFANLAMIGNIFIDIGATMGERLIYHSSLGFVMVIAWLLTDGLKKIIPQVKTQALVVVALILPLVVLCGYKTIQRNAEWKSDITLFTTDVKTVPNSVMCLGNAGARWIDLSDQPGNRDSMEIYRNRAIGYLKHALELHPKYVNGYLNLGLAYYKMGNITGAEEAWLRAKELFPRNPILAYYYQMLSRYYVNQAMQLGGKKQFAEAIEKFEKAAVLNPDDPEIWYNLGGASFTVQNFARAKTAFENCLRLKPDHQQAQQGYASLPK